MNINIYDEASIHNLSTSHLNYQNKHTVSSHNKRKAGNRHKENNPQEHNPLISHSDYTLQNYLQTLEQQPNQRRSQPNMNMYQQGLDYLTYLEQKKEYLAQQLEEKRKQICTFQPTINLSSRVMCDGLQQRGTRPRRNSLLDSQTLRLQNELQECTFSPRILRTKQDIFDRKEPIYDRNVEWKKMVMSRELEKNDSRMKEIQSKQLREYRPLQMDLRGQHRLKKNISAKYLSMCNIQQVSSTALNKY